MLFFSLKASLSFSSFPFFQSHSREKEQLLWVRQNGNVGEGGGSKPRSRDGRRGKAAVKEGAALPPSGLPRPWHLASSPRTVGGSDPACSSSVRRAVGPFSGDAAAHCPSRGCCGRREAAGGGRSFCPPRVTRPRAALRGITALFPLGTPPPGPGAHWPAETRGGRIPCADWLMAVSALPPSAQPGGARALG